MNMWAQLITMTVKPEKAAKLPDLFEHLHAAEQPDSGLLRTMVMHDQKDPNRTYVLVVFESEAKARAREQDPRRQEALKPVQAMMADVLDGPPVFVDLMVLRDVAP